MTPHPALLALAAALALPACRSTPETPQYAARVGQAVLDEEQLAMELGVLPPGLDSAAARQQVIEQWVTAELLAQEARRRGLLDEPEVRSALAESERAVLGAALVEHFFAANPGSPSDEEVEAYFAEHSDELVLREPWVRIRHLRASTDADAEAVRASMARAGTAPFADSLWRMLAREYSPDPQGAIALSGTFVPESRFRSAGEALADAIAALSPGGVSVIPVAGVYHVLQLVERRPAGARGRPEWLRDEIRERIAIDRRRDLLARQVQSLRTEALAAGRLVIPGATR